MYFSILDQNNLNKSDFIKNKQNYVEFLRTICSFNTVFIQLYQNDSNQSETLDPSEIFLKILNNFPNKEYLFQIETAKQNHDNLDDIEESEHFHFEEVHLFKF